MDRSNISRRHLLFASAGLVTTVALSSGGWAQTYPTRPIRLILGFPPGGGLDAFARLLAPYLSEKLGQPIIVENRTGANGNLATEFVAKAPADGHTLLLSTSSAVVAAPHAFPDMRVHPVRDLAPISMATESDFAIITKPDLPAKTWPDFLALAKREPGKIIHASPGVGSANHVAGELLSIRNGITMKTVHYRGSGPILTDLLANQVDMTIASVGLVEPYIKAGRVGTLLVMSKQRAPQLPEVPTSVELGLKDVDQITLWFGLHAPKATPQPIVRKLQETLVDAYKVDALRERMSATGLKVIADTPEAFLARMELDLRLYGEIFQTANIKVEQ